MPNPSLHRDVFRALSGKEQESDDVFPRERVHQHPWKVYRLRRYGVRQSDEDMRGLGAQGRLRVWRGSEGQLRAGLINVDGQPILEPLSGVRLVKIDRGGVLLTGQEWDHASDGRQIVRMPFRQSWWCVPAWRQESTAEASFPSRWASGTEPPAAGQ